MTIAKESVYDSQISPLVTQIVEICKKNKMAVFMDFIMVDTEGKELHCTTCQPDETGDTQSSHKQCTMAVY